MNGYTYTDPPLPNMDLIEALRIAILALDERIMALLVKASTESMVNPDSISSAFLTQHLNDTNAARLVLINQRQNFQALLEGRPPIPPPPPPGPEAPTP